MSGDLYLLYADDSGDRQDSFFSALLFPAQQWTEYLGRWTKFRRTTESQFGLPKSFELHAYEWLMAKGPDPLPHDPSAELNTSRGIRRTIAFNALRTIASMSDLGVVTCTHTGPQKGPAYRRMIKTVNEELDQRDAWAIAITDGDPTNPDPHVQLAHRELDIDTRRVLEDGWLQPAHKSHLLQMADLVAHCAFQAHKKSTSRRFMWSWYADHLHRLEWACACPQADADGQQ